MSSFQQTTFLFLLFCICCCSWSQGQASTSAPSSYSKEPCENVRPEIVEHQNLKLLPSFQECGSIPVSLTEPSSTTSQFGLLRRKRVAGGLAASSATEFPWLVKIYARPSTGALESEKLNDSDWFTVGAGTLISSRYILTSASISDGLDYRYIHYLTLSQVKSTSGRLYYIEKVITHGDALILATKTRNDVALLRLKDPVTFDESTRPICLPLYSDMTGLSSELKLVGWGSTVPKMKITPKVPHYVPMQLLPKEFCDRVYSARYQRLDKFGFCVRSKSNLKDGGVCPGDVGAPLMYEMADKSSGLLQKKSVQIGIAASASESECGNEGFPAVGMNVTQYLPWILDNIEP